MIKVHYRLATKDWLLPDGTTTPSFPSTFADQMMHEGKSVYWDIETPNRTIKVKSDPLSNKEYYRKYYGRNSHRKQAEEKEEPENILETPNTELALKIRNKPIPSVPLVPQRRKIVVKVY